MEDYLTPVLWMTVGFTAAAVLLSHRDQLGIPEAKGVLSSPSQVIKWLGGPFAAATWAGIDTEATKDWFEEIPTGYQMRLYLKARSEGYTITPGAFGLKSDGAPYYPLPALQNRQKAAAC